MPKTWLITGSARGLGRSITVAALDAGDQVLATARRPDQLDELTARYGAQITPVALDVTDPDAVNRAIETALSTYGRIDVAVNNAGYADLAAVEDVTVDAFRAQIDANFLGTVYVTKAVLPTMREHGSGHIIQVSSVGSRVAAPGLAAYQSAKWAVSGFSAVLAQEVAPLGIRVTAIEPGAMATDWAGSSMAVPPISDPYTPTVGQFAEMMRQHDSGAGGADPDAIARAVLEVAGRDEAPVRLLLGADAVQYAAAAAQAQADSDEAWKTTSLSVSPDQPEA